MRRLPPVLMAVVALGVALAGCREEKVEISFRPEVGASYRYELKVRSVTVTQLGTAPAEEKVDEAVLEVTDTILASAPEEVRAQTVLRRAGSPDRKFIVRYDRAAQLSAVEAVEGLPPGVLGPVALPEFLPAAATAPPRKLLAPGDSWRIDANPVLPGGVEAHLSGTGRLVKVGSSDGRRVASLQSETRLPLVRTSQVGGVTVSLEGVENTSSTTTRTVADGAVQEASTITRGEFLMTLTGPGGDDAAPVTGTMTVEVRSDTRRLRD